MTDEERVAVWMGEGPHDEPDMCEPGKWPACLLTADDEHCLNGWECQRRQEAEAERIHEKRCAAARMESDAGGRDPECPF